MILPIPKSFIFFFVLHDHVTYDFDLYNITLYFFPKSKITKKKRNI